MDVEQGAVQHCAAHSDAVTGIVAMLSHKFVATVGGDAALHVWSSAVMDDAWQPQPSTAPLAELPLNTLCASQSNAAHMLPRTFSPQHAAVHALGIGGEASDVACGDEHTGTSVRLSAMSSIASATSSPQSGHPEFALHPDFIAQQIAERQHAEPQQQAREVPKITVQTERSGSLTSSGEHPAARTPAQRVLAEQSAPLPAPRPPSASAAGDLSVTGVFRMRAKGGEQPAKLGQAQEQEGLRRGSLGRSKRLHQQWTDQQLALLDQIQSEFHVRFEGPCQFCACHTHRACHTFSDV